MHFGDFVHLTDNDSCVVAKFLDNFFEKSNFQKTFFKPGFCICYQASNVCSGPGCLVSDISRQKIFQ